MCASTRCFPEFPTAMTDRATPYDLAIVGGGINGAGIARDAAGRGLSVLLVEQDDLAAHTSSWSTKLIHGGLRYLEHYEFRLVAESLAEREVLLRLAPHIIEPLQFVLPHEPHLRPAWMIRAGLFLYDHIGGRRTLPGSFTVDLTPEAWGAGLKARFRKGFVYSDARVDDARLVVINAIDAREHGADIRVRTRLSAVTRMDDAWRLELEGPGGKAVAHARALVNAAGPWVGRVHDLAGGARGADRVRHVKGSHIVVPRVHNKPHAYILQNADKRIVFVIPYQGAFSLIGTTDIPVTAYEHPRISDDEIKYLCAIASAYLQHAVTPESVAWTYSGVRPLFDDGSTDPSAITRDYVLELEPGPQRMAPLLSIFGGKITTYRRLAESALSALAPYFPAMRPAWTETAPLPGGELPHGFAAFRADLVARHAGLPVALIDALARRHGSRAVRILGDARSVADLGTHFGGSLYAAEIDYCMREEWAHAPDDVLWRRTKCGLHLTAAQRQAASDYVRAAATTA
jgi:glycerol-3-phosphate dehydrogenase